MTLNGPPCRLCVGLRSLEDAYYVQENWELTRLTICRHKSLTIAYLETFVCDPETGSLYSFSLRYCQSTPRITMDGDIERAATNDVDQSKWRSIEIDIYPQPPADPDEDIDRCVNNLNRSTKPHLLRPLVPASSPSKTERPKFSLTLAEAFESPVIRNMFNSTGTLLLRESSMPLYEQTMINMSIEPFLEAIEYKIELPTVTNYAMGAIVQFLRTRMLPEINDLGLVAEVLMASEFLQLQSLQQWCFPIIAKQSMGKTNLISILAETGSFLKRQI